MEGLGSAPQKSVSTVAAPVSEDVRQERGRIIDLPDGPQTRGSPPCRDSIKSFLTYSFAAMITRRARSYCTWSLEMHPYAAEMRP